MQNHKAPGVRAVGCIAIFFGVILCMPLIVGLIKGTDVTSVFAFTVMLISVTLIVSGIFLFQFKNWARRIFIALAIISLLYGVFSLAIILIQGLLKDHAQPQRVLLNIFLFSFAPSTFILVYLNRKNIKDQFQ